MAVYPSFLQLEGSVPRGRDDMAVDFSVDGSVHQRGFYDTVKFDFTLIHELTIAEKATLDQFYLDNRRQTFTFTWIGDGQTYTVRFRTIPQFQWTDNCWKTQTELIGV